MPELSWIERFNKKWLGYRYVRITDGDTVIVSRVKSDASNGLRVYATQLPDKPALWIYTGQWQLKHAVENRPGATWEWL
jgi:hypothetical protein